MVESMRTSATPRFTKRYKLVSQEKAGGATYTPPLLADFVAEQIVEAANIEDQKTLRILDPAVGDGELLLSLVRHLGDKKNIEIHAFDIHGEALAIAQRRLLQLNKDIKLVPRHEDFLLHVIENFSTPNLFSESSAPERYDLIIANPPYVRTQIMGAKTARILADQFNLTGRVDLYHAFLVALSRVLAPYGMAGIIVSNRFMTTRGGASVRAAIQADFNLRHVWDFGDTKLFEAAVLPAVLLLEGKNGTAMPNTPGFTSIYETTLEPEFSSQNQISALSYDGVVRLTDDRRFEVRHGLLKSNATDVWRLSNDKADQWLSTVEANTWRTFGQVGKIRVGVKTCADKVFIRSDWHELKKCPELLRPLITHHIAQRFRAEPTKSQILYPHEVVDGNRRAIHLTIYPKSREYLEEHKKTLQGRKYVTEAGREWYEIWVPQDPDAWKERKLVFRDISEKPIFWIDEQGAIVNGDCYWMIAEKENDSELLWLAAAIANSTFAEAFYDRKFNNKLYAGRRRFITQYVEQFPLPDPNSKLGRKIIANTKAIYASAGTPSAKRTEEKTDALVWRAFGLTVEEISG
jgi:adenine-specific DNA-methyltransferase